MMRDAKAHRDPSPACPWRRRGLPALALLSLVVLAGACSGGSTGPGVAGQGSSSASPGASPSGDPRGARLAYAQCMRDHGIANFPDPDAEGHLPIDGGPNLGVDPDSAQFQEASDACSSLIPQPSDEELAYANAWQLAVARCMRESGFPSFPDPVPNEKGFAFDEQVEGGSGSELNPRDPRFQDAIEACEREANQEVP
jgi:hypothetical protein